MRSRSATRSAQSEGVQATILEDDAGDQLPSMEGTHGVKVIVAAEDADRARQLLVERENAAAEGEENDAEGE